MTSSNVQQPIDNMSKRKFSNQHEYTPDSSIEKLGRAEHLSAEELSGKAPSLSQPRVYQEASPESDGYLDCKKRKLADCREEPAATVQPRERDSTRRQEQQSNDDNTARQQAGEQKHQTLDKSVPDEEAILSNESAVEDEDIPGIECALDAGAIPSNELGIDEQDPVARWVQNSLEWPTALSERGTMSEGQSSSRSAGKRARSRTSSFSKTTQSGGTPKAWGQGHADIMLEKGLFIVAQPGASIDPRDEDLCGDILQARNSPPEEWPYLPENIGKLVEISLFRSEAKVLKELGHLIMPSPEDHHARGGFGLEYIMEAVDALWNKCTSLCGPQSKPDVCHGVSLRAFAEQERELLTTVDTCSCQGMVFPFYICEAKGSGRAIRESELQALHGASVACNTMVELYRRINAADELDRRILIFSVSHDERLVKIFGHYALTKGVENVTYHRRRLFEVDLLDSAGERTRPYEIARAIWQHFFPKHLERIKYALAEYARVVESFNARVGIRGDGDDVSEDFTPPTSHSGQNEVLAKLAEEKRSLLDLVSQMRDDARRQQEEARQQRELLERQQKELMERQGKEARQQRELLERQLEQQREDARQQREEARQQRELLERQLMEQAEQQRKMFELLQDKKRNETV